MLDKVIIIADANERLSLATKLKCHNMAIEVSLYWSLYILVTKSSVSEIIRCSRLISLAEI